MFDSSTAVRLYLNVRTAAARLGVAEITLRRMVAEKKIEHLRIGSGAGRLFFTQSNLDAYLKRAVIPAHSQAA